MFIAALLTIAKTWKQPKCPLTDEWIKKMWYMYTMEYYSAIKKERNRASLVAQWLRICLPMHRTWVRALVQEDPTCRGATKSVCHNYWACALEPMSHNYRALVPQLLKPVRLEPVLRSRRTHCTEKPMHRNKEWPLLAANRESLRAAAKTNAAKNKIKLKIN